MILGMSISGQKSQMMVIRIGESIRSAFDELLTLLVGTVEREVVIERVQALQRLVDPLLSVKKKRW